MIPAEEKTSELIRFIIQWELAKCHAVSVSYMRFKEMENAYPAVRDELNTRIPSMKDALDGN